MEASKKYRIDCYNVNMTKNIKTENKDFDNDLTAIEYAYKLKKKNINLKIMVLKRKDSQYLIKVAKIY